MKSINDENLVAIKNRRGQTYWDMPTLVHAFILDLVKFHLYEIPQQCEHNTSKPVSLPLKLKPTKGRPFHI